MSVIFTILGVLVALLIFLKLYLQAKEAVAGKEQADKRSQELETLRRDDARKKEAEDAKEAAAVSNARDAARWLRDSFGPRNP